VKAAPRHRHERNELAHLSNFRFGHVPAVADVKLGGGSSLDLCANAAKSSAENQSRSRHSLFYVLEHLERGSGDALPALVRHDHERNFAPLLVRRKRRCRASTRNMSSRVAILRDRTPKNLLWRLRCYYRTGQRLTVEHCSMPGVCFSAVNCAPVMLYKSWSSEKSCFFRTERSTASCGHALFDQIALHLPQPERRKQEPVDLFTLGRFVPV
jgi:hypothetical protein